ncbi:hypothetical protein HYX19_00515 [Candidatus Woesearchaeota archaeon]|nr:hypothetical protein [Candidatus Woesearchaeota archaeon]
MRILSNLSNAETFKKLELTLWRKLDKELSGLVLNNFEELRNKFPADDEFGEIFAYINCFKRYIRPLKAPHQPTVHIAYECQYCNKIITGPPRIEIEETIDSLRPLTGRNGLDYHCKNCSCKIGELTLELS